MSEEERKNIATIISSILISNTRKMTVRQLSTDFQQTEGYRIPHEKFGCTNLEQFLRTLSHKVVVCGFGVNAEVHAIVSSKAAHIQDLVSKQRMPKTKKPQRYNTRSNNMRYQDINRRTFHYQENHIQTSIPPPIPLVIPPQVNYKQQISPDIQYTQPITLNTPTPSSLEIASKGAVPKLIANNNNNTVCKEEEMYFSDEECVKNTKVPKDIQDKLWRLIVKHPNGILCSNLVELYRKEYEETLNFADYDYRNLAQMCVDLRNIFNFIPLDNTEIKLFDKRKPIPQDTLNIAKKLQLLKIKASAETPNENALPQADLEEIMSEIYIQKTPADVLVFGDRLEQQWIEPGTNEQDYLDVNIGEVYDPSKFWLNLKLYAAQLNNLMDSMQTYYSINKQELLVPYFALRKDLYVACIYSSEYHRARIVDDAHKNESVIKVYFVDYGTVAMINIQGVCYLHRQFSELPAQAIKARLAGIYPTTENEQWSRAASSRFLSFVLQKDLLAQLIRINVEQRILDVVLADTTAQDEDFFINDALVGLGYALFTFQERKPAENTETIPIVRYIHLYPTHYELENGLVPNAVQMINLDQAGFVIEQIYPHYFKNARTGSPISKKHVIVKEDLPVDYENERPYYKENEDYDCRYDEEEAAAAKEDVASPENTAKNHWEDIIAEVELSTSTVMEDDSKDISLQTPDDVSNREANQLNSTSNTDDSISEIIKENIKNTIKEVIKQEYPQILTTNDDNTDHPLSKIVGGDVGSDIGPVIDKEEQIHANHNIENNTKVYQTNNFTQINVATENSRSEPKTNIKKSSTNNSSLRPPPGYSNISPAHNTTTYNYNYNNAPVSHPNNYINSQTFINFPVPYNPALAMPMGYQYNYPVYDQYNSYHHIVKYIQYLINQGARLTPDQQSYLQSFNWGGHNYSQQYNNYGNMAPPAYPEAYGPPQNFQYSTSTELHQPPTANTPVKNELNRTSVLNPVAAIFTPDPSMMNPAESDDSMQSCVEKVSNDDHENHEDVTEAITNVNKDDRHEDVIEATANVDKDDTHEDVTEATTNIDEDDTQEVQSVYEECDSTGAVDELCGTKLITPISIGKLNMHIVYLENEYYFLLVELLKKIFPKTLTVLRIRKLFVASPCTISIVDIQLKKSPELKKELLLYDLIKEEDHTVDAVPVKYFEELIKIIPMPESDGCIVTNLLEEINCFLSEQNLESVY